MVGSSGVGSSLAAGRPRYTPEDANSRQVGGCHYQSEVQHWDFAAANKHDYFQGQITKYVDRWKRKGGVEDLRKAQHFLQKYIELVEAGLVDIPMDITGTTRPAKRPLDVKDHLMAADGARNPSVTGDRGGM